MILFKSSLGFSSASMRTPVLASVAALVFLARPAPARVVAPDLTLSRRSRPRGHRRADGERLALLRSRLAPVSVGSVGLGGTALHHLSHEGSRRWRRRVALHLHAEDARHDRGLDPVPQLVEHLERFVLVFDEGISLAVSAQPDALAELLHL